MVTKLKLSKLKTTNRGILEKKAALFDDLMLFIEDKLFGELLRETEGEESIPLSKAIKFLN